jgi:hypothetical protein
MADDEWIPYATAVSRMADYDDARPQFGSARFRSALEKRRIRLHGQSAEDRNCGLVEFTDEHLAGLIFEAPDRLIRPGSANTPTTVVYINIRFSASDLDRVLGELRASQERDCLRLATYYFTEPRWLVEPALAWIAYRRIELFLLGYDELQIRSLVASRDSGNADGLVSKNPAQELLKALKAGELKAIDPHDKELPAEFWDERSSDPRIWPKVRFRREDLLRLWASGPDLRVILETAIKDKGAMLTQVEAWNIAQNAGSNMRRDQVIKLLKSLGGSDKPGPKGPRKNRAALSA